MIYLSLDKVHEALDAFRKAQTLEPNNENYKQSIRICEERLTSMPGGAAAAAGVCITNKHSIINYTYVFCSGSKSTINVWFIIRR